MKPIQRRPYSLNNQRGQALLETVPLIVIFVMFISFSMGLFGVVHTAVLNSIAARAYSFETFRQRTNLYYFREDGTGLSASSSINFSKKGWRYHAVQYEVEDNRDVFVATIRPIALGTAIPNGDSSQTTNNSSIYSLQARNTNISVNPVWVMVGYGICLNMSCGN